MRMGGQKSIFHRSNEELAEVLMVVLWLELSFFIFKILIVSFTHNGGDTRVSVTKFTPTVLDFRGKFGNLFTISALQAANSLPLRWQSPSSPQQSLGTKKVIWSHKQLLKAVRKEQFPADGTWTEVLQTESFHPCPTSRIIPVPFEATAYGLVLNFCNLHWNHLTLFCLLPEILPK